MKTSFSVHAATYCQILQDWWQYIEYYNIHSTYYIHNAHIYIYMIIWYTQLSIDTSMYICKNRPLACFKLPLVLVLNWRSEGLQPTRLQLWTTKVGFGTDGERWKLLLYDGAESQGVGDVLNQVTKKCHEFNGGGKTHINLILWENFGNGFPGK